MPRYKHGVQRTKYSRVSRLSVLIIVSDRVVVIEELGVPSVRFGLIDTFVFGARGILAFHESVFIIVILTRRRLRCGIYVRGLPLCNDSDGYVYEVRHLHSHA